MCCSLIAFTELKSYIVINRTAIDKTLKKWEKVTPSHLRQGYFEKIIKAAEPFSENNLVLIDNTLDHILNIYAVVFIIGNKNYRPVELKMHMHDHIVFER